MPLYKGSRRQWCLDVSGDDELVFADGYDEAIIGIGYRDGSPIVVYDAMRIIKILCRRDRMEPDEAEEFLHYNIMDAWVGVRTPMIVRLHV